MKVYFFECSGDEAQERLEVLQRGLEAVPYVTSLKLLKNTEQAQLFLLVVEASEKPYITLPEGMRVWSFEDIEE
jgi:hypothetical protein